MKINYFDMCLWVIIRGSLRRHLSYRCCVLLLRLFIFIGFLFVTTTSFGRILTRSFCTVGGRALLLSRNLLGLLLRSSSTGLRAFAFGFRGSVGIWGCSMKEELFPGGLSLNFCPFFTFPSLCCPSSLEGFLLTFLCC